MNRAYTPADESWLRDHYHVGTINDTLDAFEREFGRRPSKQALFVKCNKMGLHKDAHGSERMVPAEKRIRWSSPEFAREKAWMLEHDAGESVFATIDAFEAEFGVRLNRSQVSLFRSTYGTSRRVSHGGGKPSKPVGSERNGKDGYIMVKVKEWPDVPQTKDNWRFKHWVEWERANGKPVPEGWTVFFADGDKRNFDPGNLVAIPRKYIGQLNNPELPKYHDRESLLACIALCDLRTATMDAEAARPRKCAVCGKTFTPTARQREYRKPVQTCQECIKAGHKAKGERRGTMAECAVCGATFKRERKDQSRCPECIEAKPKHSPEKHRAYYDSHGHR